MHSIQLPQTRPHCPPHCDRHNPAGHSTGSGNLVVSDQLLLTCGNGLLLALSSSRIQTVVTVDEQRRLVQLRHDNNDGLAKGLAELSQVALVQGFSLFAGGHFPLRYIGTRRP